MLLNLTKALKYVVPSRKALAFLGCSSCLFIEEKKPAKKSKAFLARKA